MRHLARRTFLLIVAVFCHSAVAQDHSQPAAISITKEIGGEEREISVERASDEELRSMRPSTYRAAVAQKMAGKITGPIKQFGKFAGVTLPAESVPFYAAMYLHQLFFCDYSSTPNCLGDFWEHLKDPVGHLGFAAFIAVSGATGRYLQQAMAATERMHRLYGETAARGLGPGVRARARARMRIFGGTQVALNGMAHILPMTFGMMASSIVEEIAHDQNLVHCAKGIFKETKASRSPEAMAAVDRVCDEAYDHWVSSRKIWSYGPMLANMLAAQMTSQLLQKGAGAIVKKIAVTAAARRGQTELAKKIAINGVMVLLPGGVFARGVSWGLKVANLLLFFSLSEELYADVINRPLTHWQKSGELQGLVSDFNQRLAELEKNRWNMSETYGTQKPEVQFLKEARTLAKRWTEWRQFINERFLTSFLSWQNKVTSFVGLYDTSFAFYDDFLTAYQNFNENLESKENKETDAAQPQSAEAPDVLLKASALFNPYSTPSFHAPKDWYKGIPEALQEIENYLKQQSPFSDNPELLTRLLFLNKKDQALNETEQKRILKENSIRIGPRLNDYIAIRNYLAAAQPDFPLEKFFPAGAYELEQLAKVSGNHRAIYTKQVKDKLITHAIKLMDTWLSYEVRTHSSGGFPFSLFGGTSGNTQTDEFKRACESDQFAKKAGVPENSHRVSRCRQVRLLSPDHILIKVRDKLKLPVSLPTGYLGKQTFAAKLKLLQISENAIPHPSSLAHADTPGPVDYFFASMACGPEASEKGLRIGGQKVSLEGIRQQIAEKYAEKLQGIENEDEQVRAVSEYKLELFYQTKAQIQQMGLKEIDSPFIKDSQGYSLEFIPPRIIKNPEKLSFVYQQTPAVLHQANHPEFGACWTSQRFNVYNQRWKNGENGREYQGLPELIEDNLKWELVNEKIKDPIEKNEVMKFYSWWEEDVEVPMYAAFHRFEAEFKTLLKEKFLPALLSKNVDSAKGQAIPEGIKDSMIAELQSVFRFTGEAYGHLLQSNNDPKKDELIKEWMQLRNDVENKFVGFLDNLAAGESDNFDRRQKLEAVSQELKEAIIALAQHMGMTVNLQWKPDWAKDEYTAALANTVRESGMVEIPEKSAKYMVLRYGAFRMLELEEELRVFGQMITFMPKEYTTVYKTRNANKKASDNF